MWEVTVRFGTSYIWANSLSKMTEAINPNSSNLEATYDKMVLCERRIEAVPSEEDSTQFIEFFRFFP